MEFHRQVKGSSLFCLISPGYKVARHQEGNGSTDGMWFPTLLKELPDSLQVDSQGPESHSL